jgi:hypothetical protein
MKAAMKAGQKDRLSVIRMLINDVKIIDLSPRKITEEEAVAAYAKKLRKSMEEYEKLGKAEEVGKLRSEAEIAESYLPKKATAEETERLVDEFLGKNTYGADQFGPAMGAFMKAHGAGLEGAVVSAMLRKKLSGA